MPNKKKTTSVRKSPHTKAGNGGRKPYVPVMVDEVRANSKGERYTVRVESRSNMRKGPGSNRPAKYTGSPYTYFK